MSNQWLRLWHDMPNDPKWRTISRISGQPIALVISLYVQLLVDASRNVTRGHVDVTAEDLASALDVTERDIESVLSAMQGRVLDGNRLSGWDGRQVKREDDGNEKTGAKSAAERKRDQRSRQRESSKQPKEQPADSACHDASRDVTPDKDKDKSNTTTSLRSVVESSSSSNVLETPRERPPLPQPSEQTKRIGLVCRLLRSRGVNCNPAQFAGKHQGLENHSDDDFHLAVQTLIDRGEKSIGLSLVALVLGDITAARQQATARPAPLRKASVNKLPTTYTPSGRL